MIDRLATEIEELRRLATRPTLIIIQGDHGPGSELEWEKPRRTNLIERLGIFNAWLLPEDSTLRLDPEISSINTFPLIYNSFMKTSLPMRSNQAWFVRWIWPYKFLALNPRSG